MNSTNKQTMRQSAAQAERMRTLGLTATTTTEQTPSMGKLPQLRPRRTFPFNGCHMQHLLDLDEDAGDAQPLRKPRSTTNSQEFQSALSGSGSESGCKRRPAQQQQQRSAPWRSSDRDANKSGGGEHNGLPLSPNARLRQVLAKYSSNNNVKPSSASSSTCSRNSDEQEPLESGGPPSTRVFTRMRGGVAAANTESSALPALVGASKLDYITLLGFLLGCLTSNVLSLLCWYFSWLKGQVMRLRQHFLGQANLWDFFDFEDTTQYSMKTKLLLAPVILVCGVLYCTANVLHLLIKLVRTDVPRALVELVQRCDRNHVP